MLRFSLAMRTIFIIIGITRGIPNLVANILAWLKHIKMRRKYFLYTVSSTPLFLATSLLIKRFTIYDVNFTSIRKYMTWMKCSLEFLPTYANFSFLYLWTMHHAQLHITLRTGRVWRSKVPDWRAKTITKTGFASKSVVVFAVCWKRFMTYTDFLLMLYFIITVLHYFDLKCND